MHCMHVSNLINFEKKNCIHVQGNIGPFLSSMLEGGFKNVQIPYFIFFFKHNPVFGRIKDGAKLLKVQQGESYTWQKQHTVYNNIPYFKIKNHESNKQNSIYIYKTYIQCFVFFVSLDIYTQLISPGLTDEIDVQTWRPDLKNTKKVCNAKCV